MDNETAHKVYDVLVDVCGAVESERESFVYHQTKDKVTEWRFQGDLGFGGKFWRSNGRWYVNCYAESRTPETVAIIKEANERLATLKKGADYNDKH